jgi:hypothetical protein
MVLLFLRTFLQQGAAWALAEVNVELLRCGYAALCSSADCGQRSATTIVRYLDARVRYMRLSRYATRTPTR